MHKLTIIDVGDGVGVELPLGMLSTLGVKIGDVLIARETATGYEITAHDYEVERQLEIAETVMDDCRETLRRLAQFPE